MKRAINRFIDWFEDKFNFIIDIIALIGGTFLIMFAIFMFVMIVFFQPFLPDFMDYIFIPGVIGFFGVIMLFALRITRSLTKK